MSLWDLAKHVGGYIPGVSNAEGILHGDVGKALGGPIYQGLEDVGVAPSTDWGTWGGVGNDIWGGIKKIGHAIQAPYDQKKAGYQAVMDMAGQMKQERYGQKQKAYDLSMQAYDPTRKAIAAVYGDPSSWKL